MCQSSYGCNAEEISAIENSEAQADKADANAAQEVPQLLKKNNFV
jgi:hypothetical protein